METSGIWYMVECVHEQPQNPKGKFKITFKCKNVIMATGSNQFIPSEFKRDYNIRNHTKVFTSDQVLKYQGFAEVVSQIK